MKKFASGKKTRHVNARIHHQSNKKLCFFKITKSIKKAGSGFFNRFRHCEYKFLQSAKLRGFCIFRVIRRCCIQLVHLLFPFFVIFSLQDYHRNVPCISAYLYLNKKPIILTNDIAVKAWFHRIKLHAAHILYRL